MTEENTLNGIKNRYVDFTKRIHRITSDGLGLNKYNSDTITSVVVF